jgi:transposase-like protein
MKKSNVVRLDSASSFDPLTEALRTGARRMLAAALLSEAEEYCRYYEDRCDDEGRRLVTRNGFSPSRELQTGLGPIEVAKPKIRFRGDSDSANRPEVPFSSKLLPPYLKRTKSIEELIPWLYLRGISTGDFPQALQALLGEDAKGPSAANIVRPKQA